METDIKLVRHHFTFIESWEKITIGVLTSILPLIVAIASYRYFSHSVWYWMMTIIVFVSIILHLYFWNRKMFSLAIVIQFIIAGGTVGYNVFLSMAKGIELLTGPQNEKFLSIPAQYGLINLNNISIAILVLLYGCFIINYLIRKRREF